MSSITLTAQCHCTFASFTYTLPSSTLPLKSSICFCNSCRHVTGQLFATFAVMPASIPSPDFSHLKSYTSSAQLTRYSCPQCGACVASVEPHEWEFATGMLGVISPGMLDRVQIWIEDTKDGGGSVWIKPGHEGVGVNPVRCLQGRGSEEATDEVIKGMSRRSKQETSSSSSSSPSSRGLEAACHCGTVAFVIKPPQPPDSNPGSQGGSTKYKATLDACTSCRQTSGFEITAWVYVDRSHIWKPSSTTTTRTGLEPSSQEPYPINAENEALHHYSSSPGVHRYSCAKCAASIFYVREERPSEGGDGILDIAAGLLRTTTKEGPKDTGSGARAEDWLQWQKSVDFDEDALDKGFVGMVGAGLRMWDGGNGEGR